MVPARPLERLTRNDSPILHARAIKPIIIYACWYFTFFDVSIASAGLAPVKILTMALGSSVG